MNKRDKKVLERRILEDRFEYQEVLESEGQERANQFKRQRRTLCSAIYKVSESEIIALEESLKNVKVELKLVRR